MDFNWNPPRKFYWEGAVIAAVGLMLLINLLHWHGAVALMTLPGALIMTGAGVGLLLWTGDSRLTQYAALGAVVTALALPFLALSGETLNALFFALALIAAYLAAARVSLYNYPRIAGAPDVAGHLKALAVIAMDEALMAWFKLVARAPRGQDAVRIADELARWEDYLGRTNWRNAPHAWHETPPDLIKVDSRDRRVLGKSFRHISFESGYAPDSDMPGATRWLSYENNRTAHAWVLEHAGAARPWLVCIHGYRMGSPMADLKVFDPDFFHHKLGLNVVCPILPLHGPRKKGLMSGEGYLEGDFIDFLHAERQAQWDIRRILSWLRLVKHAPRVGVYGVSLGGYNTALLAGLDDDLACAVAGIPVTDIAQTHWRHFPPLELKMMERHGVTLERVQKALSGVNPLNFPVKLESHRLGIYAGSVDTLVWPDQPLNLQKHWGSARLNWYDGSHMSFAGERAVTRTLTETFSNAGLMNNTA